VRLSTAPDVLIVIIRLIPVVLDRYPPVPIRLGITHSIPFLQRLHVREQLIDDAKLVWQLLKPFYYLSPEKWWKLLLVYRVVVL
jgi:hypothetical protein